MLYSSVSSRLQRPPITTDEGVVVHESDPSTLGDGLGLVWGSVLWPSGISLAKYIAWRGPEFVHSKRVLELGCGTGVVGLTLAKLGVRHVTLTDSESVLWPLLRKSIASNDIPEDRIWIHGLDWKDPSTFLLEGDESSSSEFDLVVAADVLYSGMDRLFARALASHLPSSEEVECSRRSPPEAMIACPFRTDSPLAEFFEASMRLGLAFDRLEDQDGCAVGAVSGIDAVEAFAGSQFVPLDSSDRRSQVSTKPTFSSCNEKQVQIFRVRRVQGTAKEAARIRRASRI